MSHPSFRDRLAWDSASGAILDESRRYMMIRPEALMGIFARLEPAPRQAALAALEESVFTQGSDSARAYQRHGGTGDALADLVAETAPQLGWGTWTVELTPDLLVFEVRNSPFAAGFGPAEHPVCHAITGMTRAVAALVFGRQATAAEVACAAMGAPACRFEARPA